VTQSATPPGFERAVPNSKAVDESELRDAMRVATLACDRARAEILPRFRRVAIETKSDGSPVTEADRAAETAIRQVIEAAFPDDAILGEEFGSKATGASRRWIIDPIDGTIAFSRGIPLFTTLIALLVDDVPVLGVIDLPASDDRISGFQGGGVWRGDERVEVSKTSSLSDALVCHGDLYCFDAAGLRPVFDGLATHARMLRGYTDAFGHLLVLSGAAEAMVDCDLNPWDAAVTRVLAHEAGGVCWVRERQDGAKLDLIFGNESTVASIGELVPS